MDELLDAIVEGLKKRGGGGATRHTFNSYGISSYFQWGNRMQSSRYQINKSTLREFRNLQWRIG